jgi:DNA (cytosine-5)-methyltransferase 1
MPRRVLAKALARRPTLHDDVRNVPADGRRLGLRPHRRRVPLPGHQQRCLERRRHRRRALRPVARVRPDHFAFFDRESSIVENSAALANRGLWAVLGTLAELGFDAEWAVLPASAFGACHIRARMFIVAHRQRGRRDGLHERQQTRRLASDPGDGRPDGADRTPAVYSSRDDADDAGQGSPDGPSETNRRGSTAKESQQCRRGRPGRAINAADPDRPSRAVREEQIMLVQQPAPIGSGWWAAEPDVVRVVHGFPGRVDRIRCLGNAVVPQVAEWIGRRLMEATQTEGV